MRVFFLCLLICVSRSLSAQSLTDEETKLYNMIIEYRAAYGLPAIPLSKSLTTVAKIHVNDLEDNFVDDGVCNMHSWSSKGNWTPCCYTSDHAQAKAMWSKPKELTKYTGYGFEIAHGGKGYTATAVSALNGWKSSTLHNDLILNHGRWDRKWNAIGVGIYGGYAVVWFGWDFDTE